MSEDTHYYWVDGQVTISEQNPVLDGVPAGCAKSPCVDAGCSIVKQRYGYYDTHRSWHPMKFEDFPPQFKLALLLLGVR